LFSVGQIWFLNNYCFGCSKLAFDYLMFWQVVIFCSLPKAKLQVKFNQVGLGILFSSASLAQQNASQQSVQRICGTLRGL
jgi:hypothetical protein